MYAKVRTTVLSGVTTEEAVVEANLASGLPGFQIVGLADLSVREARERIRAALVNEGCRFPSRKITVNLAPAGIRKDGTHFDLPIAVSILAAAGQIDKTEIGKYAFIGELSLNGGINRIDGALPLLIGLQQMGIYRVFLPAANMGEAMLLKNMRLYPVKRLRQVIRHFNGERRHSWVEASGEGLSDKKIHTATEVDFAEVRGQEAAKRAVIAAAAGCHPLLMIGPPGVGKTMISQRIPGILPELTYEEQLEITKIYSVAGKLSAAYPMVTVRPFRAPHYSLSAASFSGGGNRPRPGEISLAHTGVLFLDELPEFQRRILEFLRTPLEEGAVTISRGGEDVIFPARFMLVAAMNPCKCGYYGDGYRRCICTETQIRRYREKLSGPLLDRIDIHLELSRVPYEDATGSGNGAKKPRPPLSSREMKAQVEGARDVQKRRYSRDGIRYNSELTPGLIKNYCHLSRACEDLMKEAFHYFHLSIRRRDRILKVARTLADLSGSPEIGAEHLAEALRYRGMDRLYGEEG